MTFENLNISAKDVYELIFQKNLRTQENKAISDAHKAIIEHFEGVAAISSDVEVMFDLLSDLVYACEKNAFIGGYDTAMQLLRQAGTPGSLHTVNDEIKQRGG